MAGNPLLVNASELLREAGLRRHVSAVVGTADVDAAHDGIVGEIDVDVELESTLDDIALHGTVRVPWRGQCRRCLRPLGDVVTVDVQERYADDPSAHDEAFAIEHGQIDLRATVREHVLLAVDDAPLCRPDCPGLCPVCGTDLAVDRCDCAPSAVDERWAVLDTLRDTPGNT